FDDARLDQLVAVVDEVELPDVLRVRRHDRSSSDEHAAIVRYSSGVQALFILDPLERLGLAGDTSYALMLEAANRGWQVWTAQLEHLGLAGNDAVVDAVPTEGKDAETPALGFRIGERVAHRLADFDVVLMRKDPPVDVAYLHATWILDHAR